MTGGAWRASRIAAAVAVVLVATLPPAGNRTFVLRLFDERFLADMMANVALFIPLGMALHAPSRSWRRAALVAVALAAAVELIQLVIPGRSASPSDLVLNVGGAMVGFWLATHAGRWLDPDRRVARRLAAGAFGVAAITLSAGLWLQAWAPTTADYWAQWTPWLGHFMHYEGTLVSAQIGSAPLPDGRLPRRDDVNALLEHRAPLHLVAVAGPSPRRLADLFSVADARQQEILVVGVRRDDLLLRYRTRGVAWGLDVPGLPVTGALRHVREGDTMRLEIAREARGWCVAVNDARRCGVGHTAGNGWRLIQTHEYLPRWLLTGLSWAWLAAVVLPLGYWARPGAALGLGVLLAALLVVMPGRLAEPPTPTGEFVALAAGIGMGLAARRLRGARPAA